MSTIPTEPTARAAYYRDLAKKSAAVRRNNGIIRRRNAATEKIAAYIERTLAAAPPLTDEQRHRLAELLRPARNTAGKAA
ncbi:hypothetical protein ABQF47_12145 [Mycolicibacter sinensis]